MRSISTDRLVKANQKWENLSKRIEKEIPKEVLATMKRPERADYKIPFTRVCLHKTANHFLNS